MRSFKAATFLSTVIVVISSIILSASCVSAPETVNTAQAEALLRQGQDKEHSGNYSDAIQLYEQLISKFPGGSYATQAYESIPRCHYLWGLRLEKMGKYDGEQIDSAIWHYKLILQEYPDNPYALKLKRLTAGDPEIKTIADAEFDIDSHFRGRVLNESSYYIVQLIIYVQLYQDINQVYYRNIAVNGIKPNEAKSFEEYPWIPLWGWDNLLWSSTEAWLRVE